ncbi:hypothetical protein LIER_15838 [Lithospermum erythrorhizon]|uniref:Uncharacterized protein n=1 Tax=Lithospermum erythrorhizon TaxID=34254 RepID=A0AAV3Q4S5_LITER
MQDVHLHISKDVNLDQRVYNSLTTDQVAAIWVEGNNSHIPNQRQIVVHCHSGYTHRIQHYYGCYDPLQYPLLCPSGEIGWQQKISKISVKSGATRIRTSPDKIYDSHDAAQDIHESGSSSRHDQTSLQKQIVNQGQKDDANDSVQSPFHQSPPQKYLNKNKKVCVVCFLRI